MGGFGAGHRGDGVSAATRDSPFLASRHWRRFLALRANRFSPMIRFEAILSVSFMDTRCSCPKAMGSILAADGIRAIRHFTWTRRLPPYRLHERVDAILELAEAADGFNPETIGIRTS